MKFEVSTQEFLIIEAENEEAARAAILAGEGEVGKRIIKTLQPFRTRLEKLGSMPLGGIGTGAYVRLLHEIINDVAAGNGTAEEKEFVARLRLTPHAGGDKFIGPFGG